MDWVDDGIVATAAGTLVLAVATLCPVRRLTGRPVAERAPAGRDPASAGALPSPGPEQKIGFADNRWIKWPAARRPPT